jgi:hypothetical protein
MRKDVREFIRRQEKGPTFAGPGSIFVESASLSSTLPGKRSEVLPAAFLVELQPNCDPCLARVHDPAAPLRPRR